MEGATLPYVDELHIPTCMESGKRVRIDEMTISFQGKNGDKRRINCKRAGNGFQRDTLCENGFTCQF